MTARNERLAAGRDRGPPSRIPAPRRREYPLAPMPAGLFKLLRRKHMSSTVDGSIAAMQQAAADSARLQAASISVQTQIQGATTSAQTINSSTAAATETAKGVASDTKAASRAS